MVFGLDGAPLAHAFHPLGAAAAGSCKPSEAAGLQEFLGAVRRRFGVVLFAAQLGETPPYAKPPKGFGGADVLELINTVERTIRPIKPGHETTSSPAPMAAPKARTRLRLSSYNSASIPPLDQHHQTASGRLLAPDDRRSDPGFPTGQARGLKAHGAGSTPTPSSTPRLQCSAAQPVGQQPAANRYKIAREELTERNVRCHRLNPQGAAPWAA